MPTEIQLENPDLILATKIFQQTTAHPIQKDPTGKISKQVSPSFSLRGKNCRLEYVFDDRHIKGDIGIASTRLVTENGDTISSSACVFGETGNNEIMVTPNLDTSEDFRNQGYGSILSQLTDEIIKHAIHSHARFAGKKIRAIVFDAASIPGWSSEKAAQLGYTQQGNNIWIKTHQQSSS